MSDIKFENTYEQCLKLTEQFKIFFQVTVDDKIDDLIVEELKELADSMSLEEKCDAIIDTCYLVLQRNSLIDKTYFECLYKLFNTFPFPRSFFYCFNAVHENNMNKKFQSCEDALNDIKKYSESGSYHNDNTLEVLSNTSGAYFLRDSRTKKIIKPFKHRSPVFNFDI